MRQLPVAPEPDSQNYRPVDTGRSPEYFISSCEQHIPASRAELTPTAVSIAAEPFQPLPLKQPVSLALNSGRPLAASAPPIGLLRVTDLGSAGKLSPLRIRQPDESRKAANWEGTLSLVAKRQSSTPDLYVG